MVENRTTVEVSEGTPAHYTLDVRLYSSVEP